MREIEPHEAVHVERMVQICRERVENLLRRQCRPMSDDETITFRGDFTIERPARG